jgi:SulP family sulfate permease
LDDLTDTTSDKNREARGQGIANIISNLFGGMAGCALIGQSIINFRSGGRGRLSTFSAGVLLLFFLLVLGNSVGRIPMAALVAVMIMVCLTTFNWSSLTNIRKIPRSETAAMLTTVAATVLTHNLAVGVVFGIALSAIFFSRKIAKVVVVEKVLSADGVHHTYRIAGQIFFVAVHGLLDQFDFLGDDLRQKVTLDFTDAHIWDQAAVGAIDQMVIKFRRSGADVEIVGLNEASASLVDRLATHNDADALTSAASH